MSVGIRKAVFGLMATVIGIGLILPMVFWLVAMAIDRAMGFQAVIPLPVSLILAAASILVGVFWVTWAYSYLVFVGRGLPFELFGKAVHPTRVLVTAGPYAYVRNPMVIGELFILLGVAFLARSPSGLLLVPLSTALVYLYLAEFEEKGLVRRFGADYEDYRRNVPAMVPRLTPYVHEPAASA